MSDYEDSVSNSGVGSSSGASYSTGFATVSHSSYADTEEIESTERLILRLLKEDHNEFKQRQKGKEKIGEISNIGAALELWDNEVQGADQSLADRMMALSVSDAIASDQLAIAAIKEQERTAQSDRALALRMSGRTTITSSPVTIDQASLPGGSNKKIEFVCKTLGYLEEQSAARTQQSSNDTQASSSRTKRTHHDTCTICLDNISETPHFSPACGHIWCNNCMRQSFLEATKSQELYPPRCCGKAFSAHLAMRLLDYKELEAFCKKGVERTTKKPLYCGDKACSAFIPPWMIKDERGECIECKQPTHQTCKALGEPNHQCPTISDGTGELLDLAKQEGWKQCPKCQTLVEITIGCNQMTCVCGQQFCYNCGKIWKTCKCPHWYEWRLMSLAHRRANRETGTDADEEEVAAAVQRAVRDLRAHETCACEHHLPRQWQFVKDADDMDCETCHYTMPAFIFVCRQCQMQVCKRCKLTRLR